MTTLTFVNENGIINHLELKHIKFQSSEIELLMIQNVSLSRVTFSDPIKETILLREMEIVRDYAKFSEKLIFLIS